MTNYANTNSSNLGPNSTASNLVFDATTYPLTYVSYTPETIPNEDVVTEGVPLSFATFSNRTFMYPFPAASSTIKIEGPCTPSVGSSFNYTLASAPPSWVVITQNTSTSSQNFTLTPLLANFGSDFKLSWTS